MTVTYTKTYISGRFFERKCQSTSGSIVRTRYTESFTFNNFYCSCPCRDMHTFTHSNLPQMHANKVGHGEKNQPFTPRKRFLFNEYAAFILAAGILGYSG